MTASSIIDSVRTRLHPYTGRVRITTKVLLEHLKGKDEEVYMEIARLAPELVMQQDTKDVISEAVSTDNSKGYALAAAYGYGPFYYKRASDDKLHRIRMRGLEEISSGDGPAGYIATDAGNKDNYFFFPIDPQNKNWAGDQTDRAWFGDSDDDILIRYVPAYSVLTGSSASLNCPTFCRTLLEADLYMFGLLESNGASELDLQKAATRLQRAEENTMMHIYKFSARESVIGELSREGESYGSFHARLF